MRFDDITSLNGNLTDIAKYVDGVVKLREKELEQLRSFAELCRNLAVETGRVTDPRIMVPVLKGPRVVAAEQRQEGGDQVGQDGEEPKTEAGQPNGAKRPTVDDLKRMQSDDRSFARPAVGL